ncbi:MAG: hypothetical protein IJZ45_11820, partial [Bacteroidaceae bacterium]|nr:hypothetical protein [Bacteroidaceae bacterium]
MKKIFVCNLALIASLTATAQESLVTSSQNMKAIASPKVTAVPFCIDDAGEQFPVIWGLDTAWPDEWNMRRGTAFIGAENLGTARASFQPNDSIVDGQLSMSQKAALNNRLNLIKK